MSYESRKYENGKVFNAEDVNNIISGIDDLYEKVSSFNGGMVAEESIEYTLSQGYASGATLDNSASHRVKTNFIAGSFTIKVNEGYVIRAIYTYPTDSVSSSGVAVLSNSVDCVEHTVKNDGGYAVVTFASQSDSSKSISYTENIISKLIKYEEKVEEISGGCLTINNAVFFGDSITHGVYSYFNEAKGGQRENGFDQTDNEHLRIPAYFGKLAGCKVTNHGARGSGWVNDTRGLGNGLKKTQITNFADYDFAAYCLGINDYLQSKSLGTFDENGCPVETEGTIIGNMVLCFKQIAQQNPLCKVVCYSPYNTWGQVSFGGDYTSNTLYGDETTNYALGRKNNAGYTLQELIDTIDKVCKWYGIAHVPLSQSNICNRLTIKDIMIDGLHPSRESRALLAAEIFGKKGFDR